MGSKIAFAVFFSLLLAACANTGMSTDSSFENSTAEASGAENSGKATAPKNQMICKERAITGSRFKQKTCMTAEEWRNMAQGSQRMINDASRTGVHGNPDGG